MKMSSSVVYLVLLPAFTLSCSRDATFTLSTAGTEVLIAQDKDVMERMVKCAFTNKCDGLCVMELFPSGKVFVVKAGTKVKTRLTFSPFSSVRRVHVLDGEHRGSEGWIYDRILYGDPRDARLQRAFDRLYAIGRDGRPDKG